MTTEDRLERLERDMLSVIKLNKLQNDAMAEYATRIDETDRKLIRVLASVNPAGGGPEAN